MQYVYDRIVELSMLRTCAKQLTESAKLMQDWTPESSPPDFYREFCDWANRKFPAIDRARLYSQQRISELRDCVDDISDLRFGGVLSLVVFGSVARGEATVGSDVDWTLLVDGPSDPDHYRVALRIREQLQESDFVKPGDSGLFAGLTSSHDLIHNVGGQEDTNTNMTRRLLLLLESSAVAGPSTRDQVIKNLLRRYVEFGRGVDPLKAASLQTPRFLLNDFVRYWRTIAVDYASKKWLQDDRKWAIRNAKLRFSRKLLFLKGLLVCLDCELSADSWPWTSLGPDDYDDMPELRLQRGLSTLMEVTPVEVLCRLGKAIDAELLTVKALEAYDSFLTLLGDKVSRKVLESIGFDGALGDSHFQEVRELSKTFGGAVQELLFESNEELGHLTKKYGVF